MAVYSLISNFEIASSDRINIQRSPLGEQMTKARANFEVSAFPQLRRNWRERVRTVLAASGRPLLRFSPGGNQVLSADAGIARMKIIVLKFFEIVCIVDAAGTKLVQLPLQRDSLTFSTQQAQLYSNNIPMNRYTC